MRKCERAIWKAMLLAVILPVSLAAQNPILNSGFESWVNGNPENWFTNNVPTFGTPITQSSTSRSGSSAARLEVITLFGVTAPPTLNAGSASLGFPISQRYGSLSGFYQFSPVSTNDFLSVFVFLEKDAAIFKVEWRAENLSSGIYFYRLHADERVATKKLVLLQ